MRLVHGLPWLLLACGAGGPDSLPQAPDRAADPTAPISSEHGHPILARAPAPSPDTGPPRDTGSLVPADPDTGRAEDTGLPGAPPRCAILAPADGHRVAAAASIRFEGEVDDPDGDLWTVVWASDRWGAMVVGTAFDFVLPPGDQVVTLTASDAAGHVCTDRIRVIVDAPL